jgi:AcrR family transcriptional regulator
MAKMRASASASASPSVDVSAVTMSGGERTRRRLVDFAVRRFGDGGYRDTSLASIARDADLTAAAIHPYYRTKSDLFLAAVDVEVGRVLDAAGKATASHPLPWLGLLQYVVDHIDEHPLLARVLDGEPSDLLGEVLELPSMRAVGERFREQIVDAQRNGRVRADVDAKTMALGLETVALAMLGGVARRSASIAPQRRIAVGAVLAAALLPPGDDAVSTVAAGLRANRPRRR